jgi:hypothetical protein
MQAVLEDAAAASAAAAAAASAAGEPTDGFAWIRVGYAACQHRTSVFVLGGVVVREGRKSGEVLVLNTDRMEWRVCGVASVRGGFLCEVDGWGQRDSGWKAKGMLRSGGQCHHRAVAARPHPPTHPPTLPAHPTPPVQACRCSQRWATSPAPVTAMCLSWIPLDASSSCLGGGGRRAGAAWQTSTFWTSRPGPGFPPSRMKQRRRPPGSSAQLPLPTAACSCLAGAPAARASTTCGPLTLPPSDGSSCRCRARRRRPARAPPRACTRGSSGWWGAPATLCWMMSSLTVCRPRQVAH